MLAIALMEPPSQLFNYPGQLIEPGSSVRVNTATAGQPFEATSLGLREIRRDESTELHRQPPREPPTKVTGIHICMAGRGGLR